MNFSTKKFLEDRKKSTERSRKGELRDAGLLPDKTGIHRLTAGIAERLRKQSHPLYNQAEACVHKLTLGCDLPKTRRKKPECEACL